MFEVKLPSGLSVGIKAPTFMDRMAAVKEFKSVQREVGYILEELMAAKAIVAINGQSCEDDWAYNGEPIMKMANWDNVDVQYYIEWFMSAFFPDDKLKERAQEEAKKLMNGGSYGQKQQAKVNTSKTVG